MTGSITVTASNTHLPPNLLGEALRPADYQALESRWISREHAEMALFRRVNSIDGATIVGREGKPGDYSGIVIPYLWPGEKYVREFRVRRDHPDKERRSDGRLVDVGKYLSPPRGANMLYFPPGTDPNWLGLPELPIVLTEGEFKTIAVSRLGWHCAGDSAERPAFLTVGLSGVSNWKTRAEKTTDASGTRVSVSVPIPDLGRLVWTGRRVTILYDADVDKNSDVQTARRALTRELEDRGAEVAWFKFPKDTKPEHKGIDDFLAARGAEEVATLLAKATVKTRRKKVVAGVVEIPLAAGDWRTGLLRYNNGSPKKLLANAITALRGAPEWESVLAFNEFSLTVCTLKVTPWGDKEVLKWTDQEDRLTADWLQHHGIEVSVSVAGEAVQTVARDRSFHPVRDYLSSLSWDGKKRIDSWLKTYLGVKKSNYSSTVGARWLISAVARVYRPGAKVDSCLILEGPQGKGKSTALRTLAGQWFADEISELGSKDAALQLVGVWIIEMAELDALHRSDVSRIKSFISRQQDHFRPPYGRHAIDVPRQCVFAGTVNKSTYLQDETGGRRFWPVACGETIDIDGLARDRDQLWAEARKCLEAGEHWWLDKNKLIRAAETEQADRYEQDAWHPLIEKFIAHEDFVTVQGVLENCIRKPKENWTQTDANRVARCLRALKWERKQERIDPTDRKKREWRYRPRKK